jgi:RimJ/RimL family protein N-acetyltransferase
VSYPERIEGEIGTYERWNPTTHTEAFVALCADPEVMEHLGGPEPRALATELSERIGDHWATFGFGLWVCMDGDACVGFAGAAKPGPNWTAFGDEVEIGWRLARSAWGRGFATEGAHLAVPAVAAHLGLERVIAFIAPRNVRSRAVAARLGMELIGASRHTHLSQDVDVYGLAAVGAEAVA